MQPTTLLSVLYHLGEILSYRELKLLCEKQDVMITPAGESVGSIVSDPFYSIAIPCSIKVKDRTFAWPQPKEAE